MRLLLKVFESESDASSEYLIAGAEFSRALNKSVLKNTSGGSYRAATRLVNYLVV